MGAARRRSTGAAHPGRGDPTDLFPREFGDALLATGLSVLRWDPRDTDRSGDGGDRYDVTTIAEDSMLVLDAAGYDGAHVVGISMAGLVMAALVHAMGATTEADREWAASAVAAGDRRAAHRPDAVARHQEAAFRMGWPTMDPLRSLAVPMLVVHGGRDRVLPVAHARALGAAMPHATVHVVEDMGHIPRLGDWLAIAELIAAQAAPAG